MTFEGDKSMSGRWDGYRECDEGHLYIPGIDLACPTCKRMERSDRILAETAADWEYLTDPKHPHAKKRYLAGEDLD